MLPSLATTKSPLNSGLRHTTMRMESPGARVSGSLAGDWLWADAGRAPRTAARMSESNEKWRIDLRVPTLR